MENLTDDTDEEMYAPPTKSTISNDPVPEARPEVGIKLEDNQELVLIAEALKAAGFEPHWYTPTFHVDDDDVIIINGSD